MKVTTALKKPDVDRILHNVENTVHGAESGLRRATPDALDGAIKFVRRYPLVVGAVTYLAIMGYLAARYVRTHKE